MSKKYQTNIAKSKRYHIVGRGKSNKIIENRIIEKKIRVWNRREY